ncbi:MAG: hypothetical protein SVX43_22025 [Cyanobacteriota bacterium]|nr:hypothetical protein [Cyanobacteriota bacterium]
MRNSSRTFCNPPTVSLIVSLNIFIALTGIIIFQDYYEPGNPNRWLCCRNPLVEAVGMMGYFIGISQIIYLFPFIGYALLSRKWNFLKEIIGGMAVTLALNLAFILILIFLPK